MNKISGFVSTFIFSHAFSALAYASCDIEIEYQIKTKDGIIGQQSLCFDTEKQIKTEDTAIDIRWGFLNYALDSKSVYHYDENKLKRLQSTVKENKKEVNFLLLFSERDVSIKQIENEDSETSSIDNNQFDFHSDDLALNLIGDQTNQGTYEVLDLDELAVHKYDIDNLGTETLNIDNREIKTHKLRIENTFIRATRWYHVADGYAFLIKENGRDKDGDYWIEPTKLRKL